MSDELTTSTSPAEPQESLPPPPPIPVRRTRKRGLHQEQGAGQALRPIGSTTIYYPDRDPVRLMLYLDQESFDAMAKFYLSRIEGHRAGHRPGVKCSLLVNGAIHLHAERDPNFKMGGGVNGGGPDKPKGNNGD